MKELGITLSEKDLFTMMRSVGIGPNGKITAAAKYFTEKITTKVIILNSQRFNPAIVL